VRGANVRTGSHRVDLVIEQGNDGPLLVETSRGLRGYRDLNDKILRLAILLESTPGSQGRLVLIDPVKRDEQIERAWDDALSTIRTDLFPRVSLTVLRGNRATIGGDLPWIERIQDHLSEAGPPVLTSDIRMPRTKYFYVNLKILINRWIRRQDYISRKDLAAVSGSSYPTVANAIRRLDPYLERGPKNSIRLARFPKDDFYDMVAQGDKVRFTLKFLDTSGRPRKPTRLLEKLR